MKVISARSRFELLEFTEEEGKFAAKNGWRLDGRRFCYFTGSEEIASTHITTADDATIQAIKRHKANLIFSKATNCNGLDFPRPRGLDYLPFQQIGISYALQRERTLIGDEPGLGKTIQSIGLMNSDTSIKNVLVICPAIIKINWCRELEKWFLRGNSIGVAYKDDFPITNVVVINYDIVRELRTQIDKRLWDLLILDECQYIKDSTSWRGWSILGGMLKVKEKGKVGIQTYKCNPILSKKTLLLSGTPLVNRPEDLWTTIKLCDPEDLGVSWDYYARRYCGLWKAPWGWDSSGATHLQELQNRLRSRFMIRRLKVDVLTDLPPKRVQIVLLQPKQTEKAILEKEKQAYEKVKSKLELTIKTAEAAIKAAKQAGDLEGFKKEVKSLEKTEYGEFFELSKLRHEVALSKVSYAVEYLKLQLDEHEKIVVLAHHQDVIEQIRQAFASKIDTVVIHGGQGEKERQQAIDRFQDNPKCRLVIVSITCAIGFQLTSASYALAVELDWRSTVMEQASDRLHRIGQKNSVLIQYLLFQDSLDVKQAKMIVEKSTIIEKTLG